MKEHLTDDIIAANCDYSGSYLSIVVIGGLRVITHFSASLMKLEMWVDITPI